MAKVNWCNQLARITIRTTRLSEPPSPEALVAVNLETEIFKVLADRRCLACGDNQVIPIDVHILSKFMDKLCGRKETRSENPGSNNACIKHKSFHRKTECGAHRGKLLEVNLLTTRKLGPT
jgi:hypothetical protein